MALITHPLEIQGRLKRRFLDRLALRIKKLRKDLIDRNWPALRAECRQIKGSGDTFGFHELTHLAARAEEAIPAGELSRARTIPTARAAVELLISEIDAILVLNR